MESLIKANCYNETKWKSRCETTLLNYSNMIVRLKSDDATSKFILIYYSIALIIYSLTDKFLPDYFSNLLSDYFSIVLSVIILAFSIINMNSNYSQRISKIQEGLNELKTLKREICHEDIENFKMKYENVVDNQELRSEVDFFNTVKQLCKENDILWWLPLNFIKISGDSQLDINMKR